MILTVTPNPALDLTWHVDGLTPGATHRVAAASSRAGGKGVNVARVLHAEGHAVVALTTAGGATGAEFETELVASGLAHRLIRVDAATRRTVAIVDAGRGETSIFNELGAPLAPEAAAELLDTATRLGRSAGAVAVCGSQPPGLGDDDLGRRIRELVDAGVPVVADVNGSALLAAARAGANALKPNREELEAATGHTDPVTGARTLIELGARLVVVSLGADGLVVVDRDRPPVHARLPRPLHGNATGAGDAAVAAIAVTLAGAAEAVDLDQLARRATAWSASAVLMPLAGELSPDHAALEDEVAISRMEEAG